MRRQAQQGCRAARLGMYDPDSRRGVSEGPLAVSGRA